jgi:hypothetical protein
MVGNRVAFSAGLIPVEAAGRRSPREPARALDEAACCLLPGRGDRASVNAPLDPELTAPVIASPFLLGSVVWTAI